MKMGNRYGYGRNVDAATTEEGACDGAPDQQQYEGGWCTVMAKSARGMPLEYEMMEEPIDEIPDVEVTWFAFAI